MKHFCIDQSRILTLSFAQVVNKCKRKVIYWKLKPMIWIDSILLIWVLNLPNIYKFCLLRDEDVLKMFDEKVFLRKLRNSPETNSEIKLKLQWNCRFSVCNFIKKETVTLLLPCKLSKNFRLAFLLFTSAKLFLTDLLLFINVVTFHCTKNEVFQEEFLQ